MKSCAVTKRALRMTRIELFGLKLTLAMSFIYRPNVLTAHEQQCVDKEEKAQEALLNS